MGERSPGARGDRRRPRRAAGDGVLDHRHVGVQVLTQARRELTVPSPRTRRRKPMPTQTTTTPTISSATRPRRPRGASAFQQPVSDRNARLDRCGVAGAGELPAQVPDVDVDHVRARVMVVSHTSARAAHARARSRPDAGSYARRSTLLPSRGAPDPSRWPRRAGGPPRSRPLAEPASLDGRRRRTQVGADARRELFNGKGLATSSVSPRRGARPSAATSDPAVEQDDR